MSSPKNILVSIMILLAVIEVVKLQAADMCMRANEGRLRWRVLTGHVISTETTHDLEECADLCGKNRPCYSVNYYEKQRKCELNDQTSFHHPERMMRHAEGSYLDIHRPYSDCSDLFCDVQQVCKMDKVDRTYCKGKYGVEFKVDTISVCHVCVRAYVS